MYQQRILVLLVSILCLSEGVLFPQDAETGACLRSGDPLLPCMMSGAVSWAESVTSREIHLSEGMVLVPESVEEQPLMGDPREAQTLLEAMDRAMSRRRLIWDMEWLYPGLSMVVSRVPDPQLYFAVDRRNAMRDFKETTGRLIVKKAVLPVLLGVKLKLATLVPILIAALLILVKKALVLSKLSLLVSGLTLFRGDGSGASGGFVSSGPSYGSGGGLGLYGGSRDPTPEDTWFNRDTSEIFPNTTNSFFY